MATASDLPPNISQEFYEKPQDNEAAVQINIEHHNVIIDNNTLDLVINLLVYDKSLHNYTVAVDIAFYVKLLVEELLVRHIIGHKLAVNYM